MASRLDENDPVDKLILDRMDAFTTDGSGYLAIQNSRPQTIGYGLTDSPLLQLAWIAEKVHEWTDLPVDRDQLLTTVSLYWFTGSGASAAHTLYEQAHSSDWGAPPAVPQGFAVFGADETVRKLVPAPPGSHWTEFRHAKHFPAMEAPADLAADLQAFFAPLS
jgi:pimeloyl-ACP methyl ester carboxylesterase